MLIYTVIHHMFRHIFNGLEERYALELAVVRAQYPSEPVQFTEKPLVIHWAEGMQMLRDAGHAVGFDPLILLSVCQLSKRLAAASTVIVLRSPLVFTAL
jgi:hypothetical protein